MCIKVNSTVGKNTEIHTCMRGFGLILKFVTAELKHLCSLFNIQYNNAFDCWVFKDTSLSLKKSVISSCDFKRRCVMYIHFLYNCRLMSSVFKKREKKTGTSCNQDKHLVQGVLLFVASCLSGVSFCFCFSSDIHITAFIKDRTAAFFAPVRSKASCSTNTFTVFSPLSTLLSCSFWNVKPPLNTPGSKVTAIQVLPFSMFILESLC